MTASAAPPLDSHAWYRWGWLSGALWLVFLAFPVMVMVDLHTDLWIRLLGLGLIATFAVVYALAFVAVTRQHDGVANASWVLAVLAALVGGVAVFIGADALGMAPFVVAYAVWAYPWPRAGWIACGVAAVVLVLLAVFGLPDRWFYALPVLLVLGFSSLMRTLDAYSERQAELSEVMAVVTERERVARDVHDVLGHSLTAISVKAELAERLLEVDTTRAAHELAEVQTLARDALAEIRSTVAGLRATRIEDELEVAQESLTAAGIGVEIIGAAEDVEVVHRILLAWALREAVTNVIRHSGAARCAIELETGSLVVRDDGEATTGTEGNGLRGLRERVAASGGTVSFGAAPGGVGHELRVQL